VKHEGRYYFERLIIVEYNFVEGVINKSQQKKAPKRRLLIFQLQSKSLVQNYHHIFNGF